VGPRRLARPSGSGPIVHVGCATWAIGSKGDHLLPHVPGGNLARYAARLTAAEVNSSFHRSHRHGTWGRWARSVGPSFRFSAKAPKAVTHERRLDALAPFVEEIAMLGDKLGPVLLQFPPSRAFDADDLVSHLDALPGLRVVVEPRHASWFTDEADELLASREVARVAADPAVVARAAEPGGWPELRYFRLHGSPVTYRSSYDDAFLRRVAAQLRPGDWCIFDNTASGEALGNALTLLGNLSRSASTAIL
jgi:uncharacterized protein YecE (DUF72 family)